MWCGIIAATKASEADGVAALQFAMIAKTRLETSAAVAKPDMLTDGLLEPMLGALYAQVPSFPVGFGNKDKARVHLLKALSQNPTSIEANYFYSDFLFRQSRYVEAKNRWRPR